jgi:hypothetical protein
LKIYILFSFQFELESLISVWYLKSFHYKQGVPKFMLKLFFSEPVWNFEKQNNQLFFDFWCGYFGNIAIREKFQEVCELGANFGFLNEKEPLFFIAFLTVREIGEPSKTKLIETIISPQDLEVKNSMIWCITHVPLENM